MQEISNYNKSKLCAIGRHHMPFIGVYNNFEQTLEVQDQQSDHNKEFYSVTTYQFIKLMWMPTQGLLQSMLNWSYPLDWCKIAYHEANKVATESTRMVRMPEKHGYKID